MLGPSPWSPEEVLPHGFSLDSATNLVGDPGSASSSLDFSLTLKMRGRKRSTLPFSHRTPLVRAALL